MEDRAFFFFRSSSALRLASSSSLRAFSSCGDPARGPRCRAGPLWRRPPPPPHGAGVEDPPWARHRPQVLQDVGELSRPPPRSPAGVRGTLGRTGNLSGQGCGAGPHRQPVLALPLLLGADSLLLRSLRAALLLRADEQVGPALPLWCPAAPPHLPPRGLTILSLRAISSSSSFFRASKWLSMSACSSMRSLFWRFFWMSCERKGPLLSHRTLPGPPCGRCTLPGPRWGRPPSSDHHES